MQQTITRTPEVGASSIVQPDHSEEGEEEPRPFLSHLHRTKYRKTLCDRYAKLIFVYQIRQNYL